MSNSKRYSEGNKGSDLSYRGRVLKGLQQIADNTGTSGLAVAIAALTSAVKDHQEFELKLVRDIDSGTVIVQRNEYDEETGTWSSSYVDADGVPFVIGGSGIEYMDPETVLIQIDAVLDAIKLDTANLDVASSTRASEATLLLVNSALASIYTNLQLNTIETAKLTAAKTPTSVASTGVTNIPAGATEISVFNNGTGDATVNGVKCPAGVTRTFGFKNPTSAIIVCDGGGTEELIIDYML